MLVSVDRNPRVASRGINDAMATDDNTSLTSTRASNSGVKIRFYMSTECSKSSQQAVPGAEIVLLAG